MSEICGRSKGQRIRVFITIIQCNDFIKENEKKDIFYSNITWSSARWIEGLTRVWFVDLLKWFVEVVKREGLINVGFGFAVHLYSCFSVCCVPLIFISDNLFSWDLIYHKQSLMQIKTQMKQT